MSDSRSMTTTSSGGTKRKRVAPGFYAVKVGRIPGIYYSWQDVLENITGYKGAIQKKFSSLSEAEAWLQGGAAPSSSTHSSSKMKYYAVAAGRNPGIYHTWDDCQEQTKGFKGAKFKSFKTQAEAEQFIADKAPCAGKKRSAPTLKDEIESEASASDARYGCKASGNAAKKMKMNDGSRVVPVSNGDHRYEPGTGPLPPDAEDGFDRTITLDSINGSVKRKSEKHLKALKLHPTGDFSGPLEIYTDGSALGNGTRGAVAGVGVYFGSNDPRNVSEPLEGDRQTNQRAELTALQRAVDIIPIDRDAIIYSDSNYAIKCVTEWFVNWRKNSWKNSAGKAVENRDLVEPILARLEERNLAKGKTHFKWLKGHANNPGNVAADALAVNGAREAQRMAAQ